MNSIRVYILRAENINLNEHKLVYLVQKKNLFLHTYIPTSRLSSQKRWVEHMKRYIEALTLALRGRLALGRFLPFHTGHTGMV